MGILNTAEAWVAEDLGLNLATQGAIITSAVIVGAVVGSLFAGQAADALGPKKALLINNAWLLVGCVLCSGTPTGYWGLLAGQAPYLLAVIKEVPVSPYDIGFSSQAHQVQHIPYSTGARIGLLLLHYEVIKQAILSMELPCRESISGDWCWSCISVRAQICLRGLAGCRQRCSCHTQPGM